jgi:hypothetical protein
VSRRTCSDIDAEVLLRLANRTDITPGQRNFFINDALLAIAVTFPHPQIEKTSSAESVTSGTDNFSPTATDVWYPVMLKNTTDGYIIRNESKERCERLQTKPTTKPYAYYWYGNVFTFEAFADTTKTLKLWYKRKPVDLTGNSTSELDQMFDALIIMDAARIGLATVRDFEQAELVQREFDEYVQRHKLPVDQAKLNDYRQGWKVRFR